MSLSLIYIKLQRARIKLNLNLILLIISPNNYNKISLLNIFNISEHEKCPEFTFSTVAGVKMNAFDSRFFPRPIQGPAWLAWTVSDSQLSEITYQSKQIQVRPRVSHVRLISLAEGVKHLPSNEPKITFGSVLV